jgi:hypothetical protein
MRTVLSAVLILTGIAACRTSDLPDKGTGGAKNTRGSAGSGTAGSGGMGAAGGGAGGGFVSCPYTPPADPTTADYVAGTLTSFNDNGAWTWYCDERTVVDAAAGKIIIGSDGNASGPGGSSRDGQIEIVIYDVATKTKQRYQLGKLDPDDHDTPALLVKPDGTYVAWYAGHNQECVSHWSNWNGTAWETQKAFDWTGLGCPTSSGAKITYNNVWNMTSENKIYNFVRSVDTSPNYLVSSDNGATWTYGGRLTSTPQTGYVAGYYKYWGNGVDRIDFLATEAHPRDNDNSLWHGYVKGGKVYNSSDTVIDDTLADKTAQDITKYTKVFATGTTLGGAKLNHLWNIDIQRYDDGRIAILWTARADTNANDPDLRFAYSVFDGTKWNHTYLGRAGKKLYSDEQDYTGLGALHPNDPNVIYMSSPIDPRNDTALPHREIFQGVTCDGGATFQWTPITWKSSEDNIRPLVPAWDRQNMVLLWSRGTYSTAQIYNEEVVGIITRK